MVQKQFCVIFFFLKKMQMQTILIMESQILVGGEVDRNHYGGKFSKISKEIEFFLTFVFMLNSIQLGWLSCPVSCF